MFSWRGGSHFVNVCDRFGVRRFRLIQWFNGVDFGSRTLVFKGMCTNTSRMSSTKSCRLYRVAARATRCRFTLAAIVVVRCYKDLHVIFILFGTTSFGVNLYNRCGSFLEKMEAHELKAQLSITV